MEVVKVEMDVPKEGKEVVDAITSVIKFVFEKKPIVEAVGLLPGMMAAVEGFAALSDEVKSAQVDELSGYLVQQVMSAILKK